VNISELVELQYQNYCKLYSKTYPYNVLPKQGEHRYKFMRYMVGRILGTWENMVSENTSEETRLGYQKTKDSPHIARMVWLFWNSEINLVPDDLIKLLVKVDRTDLTEHDYILLLFLSYQNEDMQEAIKDIPLRMLHEMYSPIMHTNFKEWDLILKRKNSEKSI
jgi:hypothetical protein